MSARQRFHRILFIVAGCWPPLVAMASGLQVTVIGAAGRPVVGAGIIIEDRGGVRIAERTGTSGDVTVPGLAAGLYRVSVSKTGYVSVVEPAARVIAGKTVAVEFVLRERQGDIEEVLVVAEAMRRDAYGSVANSYLDREQLRSAPGSGADVLRALDGLPGLFSTGEFASFTVRGHGPQDNLILVDELPYDKVVHFNSSLGEQDDINGGGRFSIFAPNLIEGAEYSPGGWRAAFGGRNGSMLNLNVAKGNPSPSLSLRLDLAGAEVTYDGPSGIHENTSMIFSARQFDFGRLFDLLGENDNGSTVMTDIILKTHTDIGTNDEVEFLFLYTPESQERTVENVLAGEQLDDRTLFTAEQDSTLVGLSWKHLFGSNGQWTNRLYYRDTQKISREGEAFPDSMPMPLPPELVPVREDILTLRENEQETGWRSDVVIANAWGSFGAGLRVASVTLDFSTELADDWIRYEFDQHDSLSDPGERYLLLTPEEVNSTFARKELQSAAYLEQVLAQDNWNVRLAVRYDHDGFSGKGTVSPRLSATYDLSAATSLSATAGTFYQSPRYLQRAADPSNFGLGSEQQQHFSVGVLHQLGDHWSLLAEGYYQQLSDLVTSPDQATGVLDNNGVGTNYGFDLVLNRYMSNGWSANILYSYNQAVRDDRDGGGEYIADYNREHLFSIGGQWEINDRWQLGFRWKYATGRPRDEFVVHEDVLAELGGPLRYSREFTTRNTARWDDFHTLNFRVDYRRTIGPVDLVAFLDVLNLYGAASTDELDFDAATGKFIEDDGDIVPLIGIRFEKTW